VNLGLEGKRFVVGGGSKGLGRAVAEVLVAEGAHVLPARTLLDNDHVRRAYLGG